MTPYTYEREVAGWAFLCVGALSPWLHFPHNQQPFTLVDEVDVVITDGPCKHEFIAEWNKTFSECFPNLKPIYKEMTWGFKLYLQRERYNTWKDIFEFKWASKLTLYVDCLYKNAFFLDDLGRTSRYEMTREGPEFKEKNTDTIIPWMPCTT